MRSTPGSSAAAEVPLIVVVGRAAQGSQTDALEAAGANVIIATGGRAGPRASALDQLGHPGITSILLEGGPQLAGAFLDAGEIDEIRLFVAPVVSAARPHATRSRARASRRSPRRPARSSSSRAIADDILVSARMREW